MESEVKLFTKLSVSRPSDAGVMYGLMMCHGNTILDPQLSARTQTVLHLVSIVRTPTAHTNTAQHTNQSFHSSNLTSFIAFQPETQRVPSRHKNTLFSSWGTDSLQSLSIEKFKVYDCWFRKNKINFRN